MSQTDNYKQLLDLDLPLVLKQKQKFEEKLAKTNQELKTLQNSNYLLPKDEFLRKLKDAITKVNNRGIPEMRSCLNFNAPGLSTRHSDFDEFVKRLPVILMEDKGAEMLYFHYTEVGKEKGLKVDKKRDSKLKKLRDEKKKLKAELDTIGFMLHGLEDMVKRWIQKQAHYHEPCDPEGRFSIADDNHLMKLHDYFEIGVYADLEQVSQKHPKGTLKTQTEEAKELEQKVAQEEARRQKLEANKKKLEESERKIRGLFSMFGSKKDDDND